MSARSYLYVPADQPAKLGRALERGADALIVDLEDAVAPSAKARARGELARWLAGLGADPPAEVWVRINAVVEDRLEGTAEDVDAALAPALAGLLVAKCERATQLEALDALLASAERAHGLAPGTTPVAPLLESATGLLDARRLAAARRVVRLHLGEADLAAELGIRPSPDESELAWARSQVVLVSAACRLEAPVGPVSTDVRDLEALRASTERLARLGFGGRAVVHPAQVPVVNAVFTPSEDEVRAAAAVVARFERALAEERAAVLDADGRLIDEAVVRGARALLRRAAGAAR
ncbi:MAG TPA: aldolase/citrate lyase family protein [Acidimicrobiales bacterium]|jgi:citrate lyase subunit beta/citryl-CoA lyase|nr:aldolase/citrate lyase family protein [Acidimicrobiales bacterium]